MCKLVLSYVRILNLLARHIDYSEFSRGYLDVANLLVRWQATPRHRSVFPPTGVVYRKRR